jgi:hypothetical protein
MMPALRSSTPNARICGVENESTPYSVAFWRISKSNDSWSIIAPIE